MLANDAPETIVEHYGRISLPEYLDCNRSGKGWDEPVIGWHITTRERLSSIMANGLHVGNGKSWVNHERPEAVYLFCARSVVEQNIPAILDNPEDAVILQVTIPASHVHKLYIDNLYNMSIEAAEMSAIQYRDSIPAKWIRQ
jgi:hypothetical protein